MIAFLIILAYVVVALCVGAWTGRNVYQHGGLYSDKAHTIQPTRPGNVNGALMYACWGAAIWPFWLLMAVWLVVLAIIEWAFKRCKPLLTKIFVGKT